MSSLRRLILFGRILLLGLLLVGLTGGLSVAHAATPGILITEVMAANTRTVADDQGGYSDWIELHNPTDTPLALLGYTLTDDPTQPAKWPVPAATLAPGAFLVIWASGLDQVTPDGWHTSFRLNRGGEYVGLFAPDGQLVDEVTFWEQEADVSLGRLGTLSDQWVSFPFPTPGAANMTRHRLRAPPDAPPVEATPGSGSYAGSVTVQLYTPVPGSLLYYTLDGADPTLDGQEYTGTLAITETTVLRVVALDEGMPVSAVTTATYLVGERTGLPVLSLVTDPAHLWDEATGIYANAIGRGRRWERPVTAEWLSPEGKRGFNVDTGLRIHGGASRFAPKKSFRLYFRGVYGPRELAYPLFGDEPGQTYDRLVLQAGGIDSWACGDIAWCSSDTVVYVRDQLVRDLHGAMGQVVPQGRWVALYLNGAYWGLYNLIERIDDAFLTSYFDASEWYAISATDEITPGSAHRWYRFADWLAGADLRAAAQYELAARQLDIENFTSYILLNIWAQNRDWPAANQLVARPRAGPDGRWRFFIWDADAALFGDSEDTFSRIVTTSVRHDRGRLGQMLASLLQNAQYRTYFAAQVEHQRAEVLDTTSVRARLDALAAEVRPELAAEAARWRPDEEPAGLVAQWETALQKVVDLLDAREQLLRQWSDPETLRQLLPPRAAPQSPVTLARQPGVIITEVQAANTRTVLDDRGGYADWLELHNPTDTSIPLVGYTLTDDPTQPAKWSLPASTLAPGGFRMIWASSADRVWLDVWHASFRLNRAGGYVGLFGPDGQPVDEVTFGPQVADVSQGRLPGSDQWATFPNPTPGAANTTPPRAPPEAPPVAVTPGSGFFARLVTVHVEAPVPDSTVYYTLDGADPTVEGEAYTAPLEVTETTVLRAVALRDGVPVSAVTTATYLVEARPDLPVISLVTNPAHLWDEHTGISTNAPAWAAWGQAHERPVTVQGLSPAGELDFSVPAGIRVRGEADRPATAKQSFELRFREEYGSRELAHPLFGSQPGQIYTRLVLRAEDPENRQCRAAPLCVEEAVYVRDQLVRDLHGAMGQVAARGRWVEVYLNGEYWGVYHLTEHLDESFLTTHINASAWYTSTTTGEQSPDNAHRWQLLADWLTGADLSAAAPYAQAVQQLDIESFTSLIILGLWSGDTAWDNHNWLAARRRDGPDTRWRLFLGDTTRPPAVLDREARGALLPILASLLQNTQYRAYFTAQVEQHLAGALDTAAVRERLDALAAALHPALAAEAARWRPEQEPDMATALWEAALQRLAAALDASEQRLRHLSTPATLLQQLPQLAAPATPAVPPPLPPDTRIALVVHHPTELPPGDAAVVAHLAARGATVTVVGTHDDSGPDPAQVTASHDLLLLSSSIRRVHDVEAHYTQTATPLIFWERRLLETNPLIFREPQFWGTIPPQATLLAHRGGTRPEPIYIRVYEPAQAYLRIVDVDHPITTGLSLAQPLRAVRRPDVLHIASSTSDPGVQVLAKHLFGNDPALLVVEAGAELLNGQRMPARTVFLSWHHDTLHRSTDEVARLFDRAVDWALGLSSDDGS